jgi:hypothetical protein
LVRSTIQESPAGIENYKPTCTRRPPIANAGNLLQIQLSDEERRRSWNPAIATRTDLQATGELCFEIATWISEPIRKRWRDGKRKKLEEQLGDLIAGLIKAAAIRKKWERIRAERRGSGRNWKESGSSRNVFDELTPQGGVTFVNWRWRHARLVSSASFSMNLMNARRKPWVRTNWLRRLVIGSIGLEAEPMRRIQPSNRRLQLLPRVPHYTNGVIGIGEPDPKIMPGSPARSDSPCADETCKGEACVVLVIQVCQIS